MEFTRTPSNADAVSVAEVELEFPNSHTLRGDNRELMRHSDGAIHAALVEGSKDGQHMVLFGTTGFGSEMKPLAEIAPGEAPGYSEPATDSNQNGAYIAYVQGDGSAGAGYVAHFPDPFGDPADQRVHGPLTPGDGQAVGSFFQGSRVFNTVVYGWRDTRSGDLYVGVSKDGVEFPPAQKLSAESRVVRGPAVGIHGDYVITVYETDSPDFAPMGARNGAGGYYVWAESGDGGETWSKPAPLFPSKQAIPAAIGYSLTPASDLERTEIPLEPAAPPWDRSLQLLAWANPVDALDSRVFVLASVIPTPSEDAADWAGSNNSVGLLAFKPIAVGGEWRYVVTNRSLFRRSERTKPYLGRTGALYKYSALPGTPIRVIAYVDKAPAESELEDQVAILVSTTKGDTFDYESTFRASALQLDSDAELIISNSACCFADSSGDVWLDLLVGDGRQPESILHATLPIGIHAQGLDETLVW